MCRLCHHLLPLWETNSPEPPGKPYTMCVCVCVRLQRGENVQIVVIYFNRFFVNPKRWDRSIRYSIDEYAGGSLTCDRDVEGKGVASEGGLESPVKCARLSRGSPKGGSINLFPDGAWSRIGGVGASTSCWGTGGGMEQKLTLTGLTRLRTSVETVARKADGWSGGAHNCGVDDDGAPSSLVRNAWVLTERFRWTRVPQRLCAHDGHQRRARRGTKVLQWKNGPITNACFFFIELRCLLYCLNIGVYCA